MAFFGLAHILYILAFGFKPLNLKLAFFCYSLASISISIYFNAIDDFTLKYGVSIYTVLIFTMIWRSLARFDIKNINEYFSVTGISIPL